MMSVLGGLYFSAEMDTGAGSMIAVVAASIFIVVVIFQNIVKVAANPTDN
jgi:ABC-type Mn2+/Zn2+ transport system permease subunit